MITSEWRCVPASSGKVQRQSSHFQEKQGQLYGILHWEINVTSTSSRRHLHRTSPRRVKAADLIMESESCCFSSVEILPGGQWQSVIRRTVCTSGKYPFTRLLVYFLKK